MNETKERVKINGFDTDCITDKGNKGNKLFQFRRTIEGTFNIRAKNIEEANEILDNWDNYSLIDQTMSVDEDDISHCIDEVDIDSDYDEYSMTHTAHRDDKKVTSEEQADAENVSEETILANKMGT